MLVEREDAGFVLSFHFTSFHLRLTHLSSLSLLFDFHFAVTFPTKQVFEDEVKKAGFPLPQITAPELHPLDDPFYLQSTELYKARERLVGALGMLQACVQSPAEKLMSASFSVSMV